jgi:hypothetical protein
MAGGTFIPVKDYIDGLWPKTLFDLPDLELLDDVWMEPLYVEQEPGVTIATALLFEASLELGIPGVDAVKLVIAPLGTATSFMLRFTTDPTPSISLVAVPIALRFHGDLIKPARQKPPDANGVREWEVDPTVPFVDLQIASVTITVDFDGNISVDAGLTLNLPPAMIGDSGVVIEAQNIGIFLDTSHPPAGKPAGWRGVHIGTAAVHLPAGLSGTVGTLSMTDAYIGNGGFSGTVAADWTTPLGASIFGMQVTLEHAGVTFVQNALTASEIRGTLQLPFFNEPVDVTIALGLDGAFTLALRGGAGGLVTLTKPGVLEIELDSIAFAVESGRFIASISGKLRPLVGGLDWPGVQVQQLSIDSDGNVHLQGGWLNLHDGYRLDLSGFQFEITKLGLGSTDDGGKWVGFSGGLKLVDGMSAGASVEGLRVIWYEDGRAPALTLNGVGVEFEVPGVLRFQGAVSYRELPGGVKRFDGAIKLELTSLDLELDGQIVFGSAPGYTFFAIYLGVELPAGIPLWTTGLGLYGLAGLFADEMEPDKAPNESWYGIGPGEGWYKKAPIGVAELIKWRNQNGSLAFGAGVTIGTVADNGFTFAGRLLLAIVFPGPVIFIEGKANLLKERSSLAEDPIFRALAIIDGREGAFLVGLDADYKFGDGGELIDISGSAEGFYDFNDPMAWHLYIGMKDPTAKRIRAEIFKLFQANSYFMLDAHQLAMGAYIGYGNSWKFGPVHATLEAWIAGDAILSFKPVHFHGELWLHGRAELKVFGFGFDIGADAKISADVFDPLAIKIDVAVHLGLPWPLPDFDVDIVLQWGPEPTPPALPMPLKDIAVEHFKVTTSWPLPRTTTPALLAPNYDSNADGFLGVPAPTLAFVIGAPPPVNAPVVPLDGRPHITFGRNVNDDALVGVNPQPAFPDAQPDPGWEWIGDPTHNQGPVRIRVGLKEVALERWIDAAGTWQPVARTGPGANPLGVPALFGSWAPVPQLPGGGSAAGSPPPAGNTKLWLWSRSAFDYARHTTGQWSNWWTGTYPDYPCVPIPPDEEICCFFSDLKPAETATSPWRCPKHPEFAVGWPFPETPVVRAGAQGASLCFGAGEKVEIQLGRTVKRIRVFLSGESAGKGEHDCLDFRGRQRRALPNPYAEGGYNFSVRDRSGQPLSAARLIVRSFGGGTGVGGLDLGFTTRIDLDVQADSIDLLLSGAGPMKATAYAADGSVVASGATNGAGNLETVQLSGGKAPIAAVEISTPANEAFLHEICAVVAKNGVRVVGISRTGVVSDAVPVTGGVAEMSGRQLASVRVSSGGQGFCLIGFCIIVGLSRSDQDIREAMSQHLIEETARWKDDGFVLEPNTAYRIRIGTTLETRDFAYDAGFNTLREQTEFAYFRTSGPPGLAAISRPISAQAPDEFTSGLDDLARYIDETVPPTLPGPGEKPPLPRPVYRAYDVGVRFNEDYVDLMYRIDGRDLGLYLYDSNNQPARDVFGRLLIAPNRWGRTEDLTLTATDKDWVTTVNGSTCAAIDTSLIIHNRTLGLDGQVLAADTLYEPRLVPLLLHETFSRFNLNQTAGGNGATLPAIGGGWVVADLGANGGPSHWVIGEAGTPARRYVEQQSNIWGGPDVSANPTNPGTILLRAADPALNPDHPGQPANWTDYRLTAVLRAHDDDAIGLVVRYSGPNDHYLVALDRQRSYRRLVRVTGGVYTVIAADAVGYKLDSDMTVSVEAIGARLRVYQDGTLLFDVTDDAHPQGGIGLYCWAVEGARFADVRVDDFRAAAPVVYRFKFTTSRFTDFFHHLNSGSGHTWPAPLANVSGVAAAVAASVPLAGLTATVVDGEARAFMVLAEKAIGQAAHQDADAVEATALAADGDTVALLVRTAEPIDWARATLAVSRLTGSTPDVAAMTDAVPAGGLVAIVGWSSAPAGVVTPAAESVTLLLEEEGDPDGWRIEYRTLASAMSAAAPDGTLRLADAFRNIDRSTVADGATLFKPPLDDLTGLTVRDPLGPGVVPSHWEAAAGVIAETRPTGAIPSSPPFALHGTHLVGGDYGWRDIALSVTMRTDIASGAIGLLFRYRDETNFYRFSIAAAGAYRRLVKCVGGLFTLLWQDSTPVNVGKDYAVRIEAVGGDLRILIDGSEVCAVRDTSHAVGAIGLYDWRCKAASFAAIIVAARTQTIGEWTIFEKGPLATGSVWQREGGALSQTAAIGGSPPLAADPAAQGAYAIIGDPVWTDVRLRVRVAMSAPDAVGLVLRWQGPDDHLLVVLDARSERFSVIRHTEGVASTVWNEPGTVTLDVWRDLVVEAIGTRVRATLDATVLFDFHVAAPATGRAGVFICATGSGRFARFSVEAAAPAWFPYAAIGGIGRLAAGRRVRLFAGREGDVTAPSVTAEVRGYQDYLAGDLAGIRLPAEGVDLRLISPEGKVVHARRFAADAHFVPAPVNILRAADSTGFILVEPDGAVPAGGRLGPGVYRLAWTYRRDNTAADPGSLVLSEQGDTNAEAAQIDLTNALRP